MVLAVQDGALVGHVVMPGTVYRIGYAPDGTQIVEEVDQAALPPEAQSIVPTLPAVAQDPKLGGELPDVAADTAASIDVMVLYTAAARAEAGGTAAMQAEVNLAVASANQAYANNNLAQRLRLVFSGEVSITEGDFAGDIDRLRTDPRVGWLRNASRADLVSLITNHSSSAFCGISYLLPTNSTSFAPFAFSVVERSCATSNLSFPHELGHNMGAQHDPYVSAGDPTLFPYSHGYVDPVGRFRTIMAYPDQCTNAGVVCTRIQFFSTPNQTYNGRPLGTASTSDNARTLGQTADTVANFRQALTSSLTPAAGVNQSAFVTGQTLVLSVGLGNQGIAGTTADIYLALVLPNGTALFVREIPIVGSSSVAFGNILDFTSYRPIATGVPLGSPFSATLPNFLSYQWTGGEPRGGYVWALLVVTSGALIDGVLANNELLGASLTPFTFAPTGVADECFDSIPCKN